MMRNRILHLSVAVAASSVVLSVAALGQATLTMLFREMDPHVGQRFELRVVEQDTGLEIVRFSVPEIVSPAFDLEIADLRIGVSYRIDFYADASGNGIYDAPPADHAWRMVFPDVQEDATLTFTHNVDFTDIAWPPYLDGRIDDLEYRNGMIDADTGMSVHWQNDGSILYIGLDAPGTGWLSIGFGPERQMQGANIVIAAIVDGELVIEDHYGNAPTSHRRDDVGHVIQAAGSEAKGRSTVELAIPLASGDEQDAELEPGSEVVIILAYHRASDRLTMRHTARSTASIHLDE